MKKRKLPIVLFTALVVLIGGAFMFNVISQRSQGNDAYASEPGKDPSKATGNDTDALTTKDMKNTVAQSMKTAAAASSAPTGKQVLRHGHPGMTSDDAPSGPMILNSVAPPTQRKPNRLPSDAHGVGQWYTTDSSANQGH